MVGCFWRTCHGVNQSLNKMRTARTFLKSGAICTSQLSRSSTQAQPKTEETTDSAVSGLIDPMKRRDFFELGNLFTIRDLYNARVHFGHKEGTLDDGMRRFLFGSRLGHLIIDLDQTAELLQEALNFTAHIAFRGGIILFFARSPQFSYLVDKTAKECGEFSHTKIWRKGTFTNAEKEFKATTRLPDLCIFITSHDTILQQHTAVKDAAQMCIPTVGIVDTNCSPRLITYPVPGNDDSIDSIELYCKLFKEAILRGKTARKLIRTRLSS